MKQEWLMNVFLEKGYEKDKDVIVCTEKRRNLLTIIVS